MTLLSHRRSYDDDEARDLGLAKLVVAFCGQHRFDRHDKLFGLLGMTTSAIKPDYQMPISELFVRTSVERILETTFSKGVDGRRQFLYG